ncbi:MAG TPA: type II secretion system F family protein [Bryobacteraceae bacterium]|nr:type II secretion system F family protein [Bryobacteraceae bacterium]
MVGFFFISFMLFAAAFLAAGYYLFSLPEKSAAGMLQHRLRELRAHAAGAERRTSRTDLVRREERGSFAWLGDLISGGVLARLQRMIQQADMKYRAADVAGVSGVLFLAAFFLLGLFIPLLALRSLFSVMLALVPLLIIARKRAARLAKFEAQLPDSIDLFNRSMRAGHNMQAGLETIAAESAGPMKQEFKKVMEEIGLGSTLDAALHNLGERMPLIDLKFFITGLILQRQAGANMVTVLENLSMLVRERLSLHEKLKAATAQQRYSAALLCGMPVGFGFVLWFMKPEYIDILVNDETGSKFFLYAVISEIVGILVIRKMSSPKI